MSLEQFGGGVPQTAEVTERSPEAVDMLSQIAEAKEKFTGHILLSELAALSDADLEALDYAMNFKSMNMAIFGEAEEEGHVDEVLKMIEGLKEVGVETKSSYAVALLMALNKRLN